MYCILIVLIIYEIQWDDVDEDGERGGGLLQMYVALPQELQKYSTHFFFKSVEISIGVKCFNV